MNGPQTLDELVAAMQARGWLFTLACQGFEIHGDRYVATGYLARVESRSGVVTEFESSPLLAVTAAFEAMDRICDGVTT